jgi:hypothetical protein
MDELEAEKEEIFGQTFRKLQFPLGAVCETHSASESSAKPRETFSLQLICIECFLSID